ncbi:MAG TPA: hypothetical protein DF383_09990 [Deltaproteobacteria bacterium]|nr:hypothetical protein [Deltaproteobacteria bacterium]
MSRGLGATESCGRSLQEVVEKPVIYLYPSRPTDVLVQLDLRGDFVFTHPAYDESISGWSVTAYPDGHLLNHADKEEYSYLFWEGKNLQSSFDLSTGFVVPGNQSRDFLRSTLKKMGLTAKEYNEFLVYWVPRMQDNPYNLIHFAGEEYTQAAPLQITPKPDSMLRVFMVFQALPKPISIPEQKIVPFERKGFSVVEWGGIEL